MYSDIMLGLVFALGIYIVADIWQTHKQVTRERSQLLDNHSAKRIQSTFTNWE